MPSAFVLANAIVNGVIALSATFANGLIIYTFIETKWLRSVTNVFLFQLAIADILKAGVILPMKTYNQINDKKSMDQNLCLASGVVVTTTTVVAVLLLAAIAVVRYCRLIRWSVYERVFSKKRTLIYCLCIHLTTILLAFFPLMGVGKYSYSKFHGACFTDWSKQNIVFRSLFYFFTVAVSFTVIIYSYGQLFIVLKRYGRWLTQHNAKKRVTFQNEFKPAMAMGSETRSKTGASAQDQVKPKNIFKMKENKIGIIGDPRLVEGEQVSNKDSHQSTAETRREIAYHEIHVTKVMFAIVLAYACCWLPIFVITLLKLSNVATAHENLVHATITLVELKTLINPLIYGVWNSQFRAAMKALILRETLSSGQHIIRGRKIGQNEIELSKLAGHEDEMEIVSTNY